MGKDFLGKKMDATIDAIVKFFFETLPYLMITIGIIYFLYKILSPAIIITE